MKLSGEALQRLSDQAWVQIEDSLPNDLLVELKAEALRRSEMGLFQPAKVGRSQLQALKSSIRSDSIHWIDFNDPIFHRIRFELEELRLNLNQNLFLGLQDFEGHLACYAEGQSYEEHLDQPQLQSPLHGERILSFVLYLNENWSLESGGELCLNLPTGLLKIEPLWNRLMLFRSNEIRHSVQLAKMSRWTLTGWFRRI
jgi:SM-20-related protein